MTDSGSYLLRPSASMRPAHRIFCFAPAGMGAASFLGWRPFLPPQFELVAVQLPGRENRLREPPCRDLSQALGDIVDELLPLMDCPGSFFGHSFGALVAYECCVALQRAGRPGPAHLAVSGANPPHWPLRLDPGCIRELATLRLMQRFGWTRAEDVDSTIAAVALEVLAADLELMRRHRFAEDRLDMPLTVFGATDDPIVSVEALRRWTSLAASHELLLTTGGHFFFEAQAARIVEWLVARAGAMPLPG